MRNARNAAERCGCTPYTLQYLYTLEPSSPTFRSARHFFCFFFVQVITEQMRAQLEQADASKEEQLMRRLLRQSQAERRMAVQLLQVRREKRTIRENRAFREAQYAERRAKDFELALDRESVCPPALLYTRTAFTSSLLRCWLSFSRLFQSPSARATPRTELN